ncbi:DUF427-domain-containing protein [Amylostereum chailletii]|nr:DUF427-domain-containing protein [Amylostereum chailletii]
MDIQHHRNRLTLIYEAYKGSRMPSWNGRIRTPYKRRLTSQYYSPSMHLLPHVGHSEDSHRRVRVVFGGKYIADSNKPKLVWENEWWPYYYVPKSAVVMDYLQDAKESDGHDTYDLVVGSTVSSGAAVVYKRGDLKDYVRIDFDKVDAWFEEDQQIYVHPKDPYKRIDILQSSKHVRVEIDGVEVANTTKPRLVFETGLPTRTYIPMTDIRLDLLSSSEHTTSCPYKGTANYFDVNLPTGKKDGLAWWHKMPTAESTDIAGFVAFYDEHVDVWVNGEKVQQQTAC